MDNRLNLSPEELAKEDVVSLMVERQHNEPSRKNLESMFQALENALVYIPARITLPQEMIERFRSGDKPTPAELDAASRISPEIVINKKTGDKVMCWFTREVEMEKRKTEHNFSFIRMPVRRAIEMADDMPDAFNVVFDNYTHPVVLSLDDLIDGLDGKLFDRSEDEEDD